MRLLAISAVLLLLAGCRGGSGAKPGATCTNNRECESGAVCKSDGCRKLCTADAECPAGEICDEGSVCRVGQRDLTPRIERIDGFGTGDDSAGHTLQHVVGRMVVIGQHLDAPEAAVRLARGQESHDLEICERQSDGIVVQLPQGLTADAPYTLTVSTQAGSCAAELQVLQGEPGPQGQQGGEGPQGLKGDTGAQGLSTLALVEPESTDCINGGWLLHGGVDLDSSGTLETAEYRSTVRICHGEQGPVGPQGPTGPAGSPDTGGDILAKLAPVDGTGSGLDADTLDGRHFGIGNDPASDILAYVQQQLCELGEGSYDAATGACDANVALGTGANWQDPQCPATHPRVCTVPELMRRAPFSTLGANWYWAAHEAAKGAGNLQDLGNRDGFPDCNTTGLAPLVYIGTPRSGARRQLREVICWNDMGNYRALCCR